MYLEAMRTDLITAIAEGLAQGEYSLLTGAGSSASAHSRNGRPLPTTEPLRDELVRLLELPSGAKEAALPSVFQTARRTDPSTLVDFLVERFTGCRPADGHRRLVRLPWHRIWTFNVDDVLENAAVEMGVTHSPIHVSHDPGARTDSDAVEVVHLHGSVSDVALSIEQGGSSSAALERIVLDWRSYGSRTSTPTTWQRRFEDDVAELPFVIIGARLVDEIDSWRLLERLSGIRRSTDYPSAVVLSSVSEFDESRLRNELGLEVIVMDMEAFTSELEREYLRARARSSETLGGPVEASHVQFLQQFIDLRREPQHADALTERTRFYQGWAPTWPVIRTLAADAKLSATRRTSDAIIEQLRSTDITPTLYLLTGGPGTGKSAALLRIAADALDEGFSPWLFRGDERMEVQSAVRWSAAQQTALLLIDDLADFSSDVGEALEMAVQQSTRLVVVGAIRDQRRSYTIDQLGYSVTPKEAALGIPARAADISPADVSALVDSELQGLVVQERAGLRLTHRIVASLLIRECFDPEARFRLAVNVARALAPHIDRRQLVNVSRASRITRELVAARTVRWLCGPEYGEEFYASLEQSFGWNGRYWDQRAIWHLEQDDPALARTYAEKSVAVHRHPYALTLLGQTLFAMARGNGDGDLLIDAEVALRQARNEFTHWRYWGVDEKPFEVFFDGLLRFRTEWGLTAIPPAVSSEWPEWIHRARESRIPSVLERLDDWRTDWEEGQ